MTEPRLNHVACLRGPVHLHRMAYTEWGDPANPRVLVCVHGLTRQGRDFDTLARALAADYRVVCPDVLGRGRSDWLADPDGLPDPRLRGRHGHAAGAAGRGSRSTGWAPRWAGSSAWVWPRCSGSPLRRLVLNDVGPTHRAGLAACASAATSGQTPRWSSEDEAADALWQISTGFGPHTREQWLALTRPQLKAGRGWWLHAAQRPVDRAAVPQPSRPQMAVRPAKPCSGPPTTA